MTKQVKKVDMKKGKKHDFINMQSAKNQKHFPNCHRQKQKQLFDEKLYLL